MSALWAGWWRLAALVVGSFVLLAAAPPSRVSQERHVASLICKLGDEEFEAREAAETELRRIGKRCVAQLALAACADKDFEIRKRAGKLLNELDPGFIARAQRAPRRRRLVDEIARVERGTDAVKWGDAIPNPFSAVTEAGKRALRGQGVDVDRLLKMRARLIVGNYCGALSKTFVNLDPDTILVFGAGFVAHGDVHSVGPILAVEDAHFMGNVRGADLVWFVDRSFPRKRTSGAPLVLAPSVRASHMKAVDEDVLKGDFGWEAPADLCQPFLLIGELAEERRRLTQEIRKVEGVDVKKHAKEIGNPFANLSPEGKKKLRQRGIDVGRLGELKKTLYLNESNPQKGRLPLVNSERDAILVLGKEFSSSVPVYSVGPVIVLAEQRGFDLEVIGADLVWAVGNSRFTSAVTAAPAIIASRLRLDRLEPDSKYVWRGDFGWRRPEGWPDLKVKKE